MGLSEQEQREQFERDRQAHDERVRHLELGLAFMLDGELDLKNLDGETWSFEDPTPFSPAYGKFPSPADALVALGKIGGDFRGLQ